VNEMPAVSPDSCVAIGVTPATVMVGAPRFSSKRAYAQTFAATFVIRCLGIFSGVLAARLLGPQGRGELAAIILLPMMLVPVGELELPRSVAFEASRTDFLSGRFLATCFWLAGALGVVQAVVLAVALPHYLPLDKLHLLPAARWFVVYLPVTLISATLIGSDQGRGRFGRFSFLLALPGGLYLAGILVVWAIGRASSETFAFSLLGATLITAGVRAGMDGRAIWASTPDWALAGRLLKRGVSYYLPAVAGFLLARADMFVVVRFAPLNEVGLYSVALAIALGQMGSVNPFIQVGFAAVAGEVEPASALRTLARHFRLAQLASVGSGLLAMALTPWAIRILFGPQFVAAAPATYLLIGATVFWGMGQVLEQGLRAAGHPPAGIASNLVGLAVIFGVGTPMCLRFGITGVAASFLMAQSLNLSALITYCVVRLGMPWSAFWAMDGQSAKEFRSAAFSLLVSLRARIFQDQYASGT
jgi:O-antigen/teichoic acid export membrane protein